MIFYERASGSRMHAAYFRPGGVHEDLPQKLVDDIGAFCDPFLKVVDDLDELLTGNRIFKQRNVDIGVVSLEDTWKWGFSGVMVRGSGAAWDLRKAQPYECYADLDFDIPVGRNSDCYDRYLVRMEEMRQATKIMKQCVERLNSEAGRGPVSSTDGKMMPVRRLGREASRVLRLYRGEPCRAKDREDFRRTAGVSGDLAPLAQSEEGGDAAIRMVGEMLDRAHSRRDRDLLHDVLLEPVRKIAHIEVCGTTPCGCAVRTT